MTCWRSGPAATLDTYFEKRIAQLEQLAAILDDVERIEIKEDNRVPDIRRARRVMDELRELRIELEEDIIKLE
jgi:hypothetical protein